MTAETDFCGIPIQILNKKLDVELHNLLVEKGKPLEETGIEPISIYCTKKILRMEPGQMDCMCYRNDTWVYNIVVPYNTYGEEREK